MALPELNFGQADRVLTNYFKEGTPKNAWGARAVIENYHRGNSDILPNSPLKLIEIYWALQIISCLGMNIHHAADPKRADRRFGQWLRKNRTGSRRG